MIDEMSKVWFAVWGLVQCPQCGRLSPVEFALDTPYFAKHSGQVGRYGPAPLPPCPMSGHWDKALNVLDRLQDPIVDAMIE